MLVAMAGLQAEVLDRVLRYVNGDMLTQRELITRMRSEMRDMRMAGISPPRGGSELRDFQQGILDVLTEERLLIQESERLGVVLDERQIRRATNAWSDRTGRARTIEARMKEVERRLDRQRMEAVLRFYVDHTPGITPNDLRQAYRDRVAEYTLPDRRQLLRLTVRVDPPERAVALRRELLRLFQNAGISADPAVAAVVDEQARERVLAVPSGPERDAVLRDIAAAVAEAIGDQVLDPALAALREQARGVVSEYDQVRDVAAATQLLQAVHDEVMAADDAFERQRRFRAAARRLMGAEANIDLGVVERGNVGEPYDSIGFELPVHAVSEPFEAGQVQALLFVAEVQPSQVRSFTEVSAELRRELQAELATEIRSMVIADLIERAAIEDVTVEDLRPEDLEELRAEAAAQQAQ